MATWVIGDVQGCWATLERLLERIAYDEARDRLWFVGDLVNRGLGSLEVLRWISRQDEGRVRSVLGNHDLHLLACAEKVRRPKGQDTLDAVLAAPDRADLIDWLAARPVCFVEPVAPARVLVVHAGVLPVWTLAEVEALAREAEAELRASPRRVLESLQTDGADQWTPGLGKRERTRFALAALTRIRTVVAPDRMDPEFSGGPEEAPKGRRPWFDLWPDAGGASAPDVVVAFGHWAALGLRLERRTLGLDSGCVWGRSLTALRLEDRAVVDEPAAKRDLPR
jgi:bis(5'-nucleosyl)-tetraphosphatase (symmetrical)